MKKLRSRIAQRLNVEENCSEVGDAGRAALFAKDLLQRRTAHAKCGTYRLASSLAAVLLDRLFEHPAKCVPIVKEV